MIMRTLLFSLAVLSAVLPVSAQEYVPKTNWPYVYEEFSPGRIVTHQGSEIDYDKLNVNLVSGKTHYVQDGIIMQADPNTIALLEIGNDSYICVGGRMYKILQRTESGAVLLRTTIDTDAMASADIGYGKSSIASTSNLSLSAISSGMDYSVNRSLDDLLSERSSGEPLVLSTVMGLYYKGTFVPASRSDVLKIPGIDKNLVKQYLKKEKIRFGKVEDLASLLDYLNTLQ